METWKAGIFLTMRQNGISLKGIMLVYDSWWCNHDVCKHWCQTKELCWPLGQQCYVLKLVKRAFKWWCRNWGPLQAAPVLIEDVFIGSSLYCCRRVTLGKKLFLVLTCLTASTQNSLMDWWWASRDERFCSCSFSCDSKLY
jgi:hypothetical protein